MMHLWRLCSPTLADIRVLTFLIAAGVEDAVMRGPVSLQFGEFTLDVTERRLLRDGRPVPLAPKAFDVLAALAARPGRLVTKDELLKEVWPDSFVEESNLAYHVFALRRALGETADGESHVETVPKRGFGSSQQLRRSMAPMMRPCSAPRPAPPAQATRSYRASTPALPN